MFTEVKKLMKRSRFAVGAKTALEGAVADVKTLSWTLSRRRRINAYFSGNPSRKLQLGANTNILPGWLNTDLFPAVPDVVYLDATRRFPFDDNSFDYVFSEHMIEHIDHDEAITMLKECYRVLRPRGRLRVATPDLAVVIGLLATEKTALQTNYIEWIARNCLPEVNPCTDVFVINNAFRSWGHRFLYDRDTLAAALSKCGFENITFFNPLISNDAALKNLETHGKEIQSEEINQFETFVAEAECLKRAR